MDMGWSDRVEEGSGWENDIDYLIVVSVFFFLKDFDYGKLFSFPTELLNVTNVFHFQLSC